jgi:GNAT superfamily N-acetyltransferase
MAGASIVTLTPAKIAEYGIYCIRDPKTEGYRAKTKWLEARFKEGLQFKLIYSAGEAKPAGFIEYTPGEVNWRALEAPGWLVIHCIMVQHKKHQRQGLGRMLVESCLQDAKRQKRTGVAVLASDGAWCADGRIFEKLGFEVAAEADRFRLLVKRLKRGPLPKFRDWESRLAKTKGWQLAYCHQCPWHAKAVHELSKVAEQKDLSLQMIELKSPAKAQQAPAAFGVFSLTQDGRLLADHYISATRFRNILKQELR